MGKRSPAEEPWSVKRCRKLVAKLCHAYHDLDAFGKDVHGLWDMQRYLRYKAEDHHMRALFVKEQRFMHSMVSCLVEGLTAVLDECQAHSLNECQAHSLNTPGSPNSSPQGQAGSACFDPDVLGGSNLMGLSSLCACLATCAIEYVDLLPERMQEAAALELQREVDGQGLVPVLTGVISHVSAALQANSSDTVLLTFSSDLLGLVESLNQSFPGGFLSGTSLTAAMLPAASLAAAVFCSWTAQEAEEEIAAAAAAAAAESSRKKAAAGKGGSSGSSDSKKGSSGGGSRQKGPRKQKHSHSTTDGGLDSDEEGEVSLGAGPSAADIHLTRGWALDDATSFAEMFTLGLGEKLAELQQRQQQQQQRKEQQQREQQQAGEQQESRQQPEQQQLLQQARRLLLQEQQLLATQQQLLQQEQELLQQKKQVHAQLQLGQEQQLDQQEKQLQHRQQQLQQRHGQLQQQEEQLQRREHVLQQREQQQERQQAAQQTPTTPQQQQQQQQDEDDGLTQALIDRLLSSGNVQLLLLVNLGVLARAFYQHLQGVSPVPHPDPGSSNSTGGDVGGSVNSPQQKQQKQQQSSSPQKLQQQDESKRRQQQQGQENHEQQQQKGLQVAARHADLFDAMGVPAPLGVEVNVEDYFDELTSDMAATVLAIAQALQLNLNESSSSSSSSSSSDGSSNGNSSQRQQHRFTGFSFAKAADRQQAGVSSDVQQTTTTSSSSSMAPPAKALLLVLLQLVLLVPQPRLVVTCLQAMAVLGSSATPECAGLLGLNQLAAAVLHVCDGSIEGQRQQRQGQQQQGQQQQGQQAGDGDKQQQQEDAEARSSVMRLFGFLLVKVGPCCLRHSDVLVTAPLVSLKALESGLRAVASGFNPQLETVQGLGLVRSGLTACELLQFCEGVVGWEPVRRLADEAVVAQQPTTQTSMLTQQQQQQQQQEQEQVQFSLLLTCLKAAAAAVGTNQPPCQMHPQQLSLVWKIVLAVMSASSSSSSNKQHTSNEAAAAGAAVTGALAMPAALASTSYMVLVARALSLAGQIVPQLCESDALAPATADAVAVAAAIHWLGDQLGHQSFVLPGEPGQAAAALQQLQQQQAQLWEAMSAIIAAGANTVAAEANNFVHSVPDPANASAQQFRRVWSSSLAGQLQQFAAALCAQLPARCCNNPACVNLEQPSEAQLVGGKSCICAGCKTARYCSKACQVAHWKQHRPVCRRL